MEPIHPFRWDVKKREQLGGLLDEFDIDAGEWFEAQAGRLGGYRWRDPITNSWLMRPLLPDFAAFLSEVSECSSRIIGFCENSDLCFLGRSLESIFDFLSGALLETNWQNRISLVHFSMRERDFTERGAANVLSGGIEAYRQYLDHIGVSPTSLATRERPVALVDIVVTGGTLRNFISILHNWSLECGADWNLIRRRIRIVGLTIKRKTSPNTWRWQQHADWLSVLMPNSVRNIPINNTLFDFFGAFQWKTTESFVPWRWGDSRVMKPGRDRESLGALRGAILLFDAGRDKAERLRFARKLSNLPAMKHAWFRSLAHELSH